MAGTPVALLLSVNNMRNEKDKEGKTMRYTASFTVLVAFLVSSIAAGATVDRSDVPDVETEVVSTAVEYESVPLPGFTQEPIETMASQISADPQWGLPILEQTPSTVADANADEDTFGSHEEVKEFLRTAKVVSQKRVKVGINGIYKVKLEKDGVERHAAFRTVDVDAKNKVVTMADGSTRIGFRDDCLFELAAYRFSRLLGLDNVPPVVKRKIRGKPGTLQLWVENAMMEKKRQKEKIKPPNQVRWVYQRQVMRLFDNLIDNEDRNPGNILIDADWKLWLIDHTRAFRCHQELQNPQFVRYCPRTVWARLTQLDRDLLKQELKGTLSGKEITALAARCDLLVDHIQNLIDTNGRGAVLF